MSHAERIQSMLNKTAPQKFAENCWGMRHCAAWREPSSRAESAIVGMVNAAADYADQHEAKFETKIGDDGVLGPHWQAIVNGIRGLLDGECGRLDCGTVNSLLCEMLRREEFEE